MPETVLDGQKYLTLGQLAERVGVSTHQVKYAIGQYTIKPAGRAGILRLWNEDAVPQLRSALNRIASNKGGDFCGS